MSGNFSRFSQKRSLCVIRYRKKIIKLGAMFCIPRKLCLFSVAVFFGLVAAHAQDSDLVQDSVKKEKISEASRDFHVGFFYEFANLHSADIQHVMTRKGVWQDLKIEASDMAGLSGRYTFGRWISFYGLLGYQKLDIGYSPRKDSTARREWTSSQNLSLELGTEIGFSFLEVKGYQLRLMGFFGAKGGFMFLDDSYFANMPLFGYSRGIAFDAKMRRFSVLVGIRASHTYWHTYKRNHWKSDDHSFMLDFDTMSSPFLSISFGI